MCIHFFYGETNGPEGAGTLAASNQRLMMIEVSRRDRDGQFDDYRVYYDIAPVYAS